MQQAGRVSDYTAFFYLGELVEWDTTKNILLTPKTFVLKTMLQDVLVDIGLLLCLYVWCNFFITNILKKISK